MHATSGNCLSRATVKSTGDVMVMAKWAQNLPMYLELRRIVSAFKSNSIDLIILKGMVLSKLIYNNALLRKSSDIDLLVREKDLELTVELLTALGYESDCILKFFNDRYRKVLQEHKGEVDFVNTKTGLVLDLHWRLVTPKIYGASVNMEMDKLWRDAYFIRIGDVEVLTLSLEHIFFHLCLHFSVNHSFTSKRHLDEILLFLERNRENINWNGFVADVSEFKIKKSIYYTLQHLKKIGEEVDSMACSLDGLAQFGATRIDNVLLDETDYFFTRGSCVSGRIAFLRSVVRNMLCQVVLIDSYHDRMSILRKFAFPDLALLRLIYWFVERERNIFIFIVLHFIVILCLFNAAVLLYFKSLMDSIILRCRRLYAFL